MAAASGVRQNQVGCTLSEPREQQVLAGGSGQAKRGKRARRLARALQVLVVALAVGWAGGSKTSAWAQAVSNVPRAGSSIGNQASATYTDGSGATRTVTSNTVQTIVTQVPGVSLTQDQDVRGATGQPVYFPHVVSNTGNGPAPTRSGRLRTRPT